MKKSTVDTQAQRLRQAIRHRQAQEKQELRPSETILQVNASLKER